MDEPKRKRARTFGSIREVGTGKAKRYQARYTDPIGLRHNAPAMFTSKADAEAWLAQRHTDILRGSWAPERPSARVGFEEYARAWLAHRDLKPRTRTEYRRLIDGVLRPAFGETPLGAITPEAVRAWYASLDPKAPTQRARAYELLRTILGTAVVDDLLPANPCRIRGASRVTRARTIRPAEPDELVTMAEAMPERLRMLVLVSAWGGLRFGEATELRRKDVDGALLRIRRAVTRAGGGYVVGTPKSAAGVRDVNLPPSMAAPLAEHVERFAAAGPDGLLFPGEGGQHLAPATLYRHWYKARAAAGRDDMSWHALRHTGATFAAVSGATLAELMRRLGHSTPGAALIYQHAANERDAAIAARLDELAAGKREA
jgi:integrase